MLTFEEKLSIIESFPELERKRIIKTCELSL